MEGEVVDTTRMLFTIVDNRRMWLLLDVALEDAQYVKLGQQVVFHPDGGTREHSGQITWISSRIDAETRTVKVRAELPNADGGLRDESFGAGRIVLREDGEAIVAPNAAIHWEGCCHVVFVRLSDEVFQTRKLRLGARSGPFTEVLVGVVAGEVVATRGSHVLKSELLKSKLGAGCVDD